MIQIGHIMTRDVFTLSTTATADQAARALTERGIGGAPVRDGAGRLVGVVSRTDLADPERRPPAGRPLTVADVMTPALLALRESDTAMNAVRLMVREEVHRIVVLDEDGELCGIITPTDVLRALGLGDPLAGDEDDGRGNGPVTIQ
jgi:CBS-domain-containing membrane protein